MIDKLPAVSIVPYYAKPGWHSPEIFDPERGRSYCSPKDLPPSDPKNRGVGVIIPPSEADFAWLAQFHE